MKRPTAASKSLSLVIFTYIGLNEAHVVQPCSGCAGFSSRNRTRVALNPDHFARRTDNPRQEHGDVADSRAKVENALPWTDARLAK